MSDLSRLKVALDRLERLCSSILEADDGKVSVSPARSQVPVLQEEVFGIIEDLAGAMRHVEAEAKAEADTGNV